MELVDLVDLGAGSAGLALVSDQRDRALAGWWLGKGENLAAVTTWRGAG